MYKKLTKSSKSILDRKPNEMRINLFNGKILLAWKANLDIQVFLNHMVVRLILLVISVNLREE